MVVGRIDGAFGLRGELKVTAPDADALRPGLNVLVKLPNGQGRAATIDGVRPHKKVIITRLTGVDDARAARSLQGASIFAARRDLPRLPARTYREADLVGMRVVDATLGVLGEVRELRRYPSCHMLVVGEKKMLVPMLRAFEVEVDLAMEEIHVKLPAGFDELV